MPNKQVRQGEVFLLPLALDAGNPFPPVIHRRRYDEAKLVALSDPAPGIYARQSMNPAFVEVTVSRSALVAENYAVGNTALETNEWFDVLPLSAGIPKKRRRRQSMTKGGGWFVMR